MNDTNPYRHPAGRTCSGAAATIAAVIATLAMLGRKVGAR